MTAEMDRYLELYNDSQKENKYSLIVQLDRAV